jgi:hypothetical protein
MSNGKRNALRNSNGRGGLSRVWELVAWWWAGTSEARMRRWVDRVVAS